VFKVPGLRNAEMTSPYFHDGSVKELREAIRIMGKVQLGQTLEDKSVDVILLFIKSLTGQIPKEYRTVPILPASE
jgi:cytochrome c peroxidase